MIKVPRGKDTPLTDAVREVITKTDPSPIKEFVRRGLNFLKEAAREIREEREGKEEKEK